MENIVLENISISYQDRPIIKNLSLQIPFGQTTAILGRSGAGKTSLINSLMGLTPFEGKISGLKGKKLSAVFQEDRLIEDLGLLKNISIVSPASEGEIKSHIQEIGLSGEASKKAGKLSGGMKRRTAILRAILAEPDIIIMDEPFKGLDEQTKILTMAYVKKYTQGKTLILVTHDRSEIEYFSCQKILDLSE